MKSKTTIGIRWVARVGTLISLGLILLFLFGEGSYPSKWKEWVGFLFFPFGIAIGMIVAWWREGLGG